MKNKNIIFLGGMNAMPMMYAVELRKRGMDVQYLVDADKNDTLSRPEFHFPDINYPYPEWIKEFKVPSLLLVSVLPFLFYKIFSGILNIDAATHVFLSGPYISLGPYFKKNNVSVQHLTYGADLDFFCNKSKIKTLQDEFCNKSFTRYLPRFLTNRIIAGSVSNHVKGAECADNLICFPKGFSESGDEVIDYLESVGVRYLPRFDISLEILKGIDYSFRSGRSVITLLCATRFHYFNRVGENKGNDLIIKGIALFLEYSKKGARIIFFNKGPDLDRAKKLCVDLGIDRHVEWIDPVPMKKLVDYYLESDICFDQVGDHWISAVGVYALLLGKPTIANSEKLEKIFPNNPICNAKTPEDIAQHLLFLVDEGNRRQVSEKSYAFANKSFSPEQVIDCIFSENVYG